MGWARAGAQERRSKVRGGCAVEKLMRPRRPPSQGGTPAGCKKLMFMADGGAWAYALLKVRGEGGESDNNNHECKDISQPLKPNRQPRPKRFLKQANRKPSSQWLAEHAT